MRYFRVFISVFLVLLSSIILSKEDIFKKNNLSPQIIKAIKNNKVYSHSVVTNMLGPNQIKFQELNFRITGLHKKTCAPVLRKLSVYENYSKYLTFVKYSHYDSQSQRIKLSLNASILPINMFLDFKIPRITKIGNYKFYFDKGFLKGLTGLIKIRQVDKRCFFYTTAYWLGPHSKFPNFIFEFFSSTLAKLAMENLFRISKTL